jgi:lipid II isoglutaminyl synthase (glutamine-hydrolysing)
VVSQIRINTFFSIILSKVILKTSKVLFKGGTNFPGRVALKLDKHILKTAAQGYNVILITGTNGKTTTTSLTYSMLKDSGRKVITNSTGANMLPGIVSCFIENFSFGKKNVEVFAVIEVDEANVKLVTEYITPKIITVTNLFRDQLDRYGEVYTTLKKIREGLENVEESTLVLNGDESLLGDMGLKNNNVFYGFNCSPYNTNKIDVNADAKFCIKCKSPYQYNFLTYNHLGSYYCQGCGYKRPELKYSVDIISELTTEGSLVTINGNEYYINQPGIYNVYNALCAFSIAKTLGIENSIIFNALKSARSSFGRQESLTIENKNVKIILVKNPAGYDQAINTISLDKNNMNIAFLLNDNYADGRDVSWIWDVNFEKLSSLKLMKIMVGGIRLYDMAVRLKVSGLDENKFSMCDTFEHLLEEIKSCSDNKVYILATYTAMISLRKFLHSKGYIGKLW